MILRAELLERWTLMEAAREAEAFQLERDDRLARKIASECSEIFKRAGRRRRR